MLIDVEQLTYAYYAHVPVVSIPGQRIAFGTSGHRGAALETSFNETHVLAISQAICDYRAEPPLVVRSLSALIRMRFRGPPL